MNLTRGGEIYAIKVEKETLKQGSDWIGESFEPLQGQRVCGEIGKKFRLHRHVMNPRIIKRTQEAFIVISGIIQVNIYDDERVIIGSVLIDEGEALFVYRGYHSLKVIKDCVFYEVKAGQYTYVSEDKEF